MFKRRYLKLSLFAICILALIISFNGGGNLQTASADGVSEIALELERGDVLYSKNADRRLPMASTTKIMTALIVCEECDLCEVITVPDKAVGVEGSSIYLKKDERISVKDLLYGLMLRSGNDAACALAIHHSGSLEAFVERMNARAGELGAVNTNFCNPSGLPDDNHYTTAFDLCNIACAAMKNAVFAEVVSTKSYKGDFRSFVNKNKLLTTLDGANGVKTGYTEKAGRCLVSSAKRGNMDVVCVVLNCYDMFERSAHIIDKCFDNFAVETISKDVIFDFNGRACSLKNDVSFTVNKSAEISYKLTPADSADAVAKLEIYNQNNLIFCENLFTIN